MAEGGLLHAQQVAGGRRRKPFSGSADRPTRSLIVRVGLSHLGWHFCSYAGTAELWEPKIPTLIFKPSSAHCGSTTRSCKTTAGGRTRTDGMMTCRVSTLCAWELNPDGTDWSVGQTRRMREMFNVKVALRILLGTKDYIKFKTR